MIKKFVQGNKTDQELFCLIGRWAISEEIHAALGTPVTGRNNDIWLIAPEGQGFCQVRVMKNGTAHVRYLFAPGSADRKKLVTAALEYASEANCKSIFTNDRKTSVVWETFGFTHHENQRKGVFVRWEKELK